MRVHARRVRNLSIAELARFVRARGELLADGWEAHELDRTGEGSPFHRVHRNRYVPRTLWSEMWPESRHRTEVIAATMEMQGGAGVVSHLSAAVVLGLPVFKHRPREVEFTVCGKLRAASRSGIRRHLDRLESVDVVMVDGIRCTSLERTVFDVARLYPAEVALACMDASLRSISVDGQRWDAAAHDDWKERMAARTRDSVGARGIKQARWLIDLADGRAQLPGESVSRLQLIRLGFARPLLQVPVPSPGGGSYWVDFALHDVNAWGEFDGKDKYLDEAMRCGRSLEEVLLDEKSREDWIRGRSQWRFARWGDADIGSPDALRRRLAAFGIRAPR